jgi:ribosome-associated translation inhibitor RaiA
MMVPLDVRFRSIKRDEKVVWAIDGYIAELDKLYDSIIGCHVTISGPTTDEFVGSDTMDHTYNVQVQLVLPCREISIKESQYTDVYAAVDSAFESLRHELQSWLCERRLQRSYSR